MRDTGTLTTQPVRGIRFAVLITEHDLQPGPVQVGNLVDATGHTGISGPRSVKTVPARPSWHEIRTYAAL
ncbi:hypothetical protein [Mycolicibacterium cosmeticum]|uniref:hypothetical protein n=1 Tax=Mycolicibacterium cosmeticum TaxID=258533 RepID=UPI003D160F4F